PYPTLFRSEEEFDPTEAHQHPADEGTLPPPVLEATALPAAVGRLSGRGVDRRGVGGRGIGCCGLGRRRVEIGGLVALGGHGIEFGRFGIGLAVLALSG